MGKQDPEFYLEDPTPDHAGPNIGEVILHAIARFPMTIVACTLLGTAAAIVFAFSQPNTYRSVGMLLVRLGVREQQSPEGAVAENFQVRSGGFQAGDELLMLLNPELHRRVVNEVGARRILQRYDPRARDGPKTPESVRWLHDLQAWLMGSSEVREVSDRPATQEQIAAAISRVAAGVEINIQRLTSTLLVSYTTHEPELAQLVTNAFLKVFQERHREIFATNNELSFISEKRVQADEAAAAASQALRDRREQDGIYDLQSLQNGLAQEIRDLASRNGEDAVLKRTLDRQLDIVASQIELHQPDPDVPPAELPVPRAVQTFRYNSLVTQLGQMNVQLAELESTYAPGSTILREERALLDERIAGIQRELSEIEAQQGPVPLLTQTPQDSGLVLAQLVSQRLELTQQRQALEAGLEIRQQLIEERQARLDELVLLEPAYEALQHAVTETSQRAAQLARAHSQAQILEMIDADERMTNLIVTQEATLPTEKEGPQRLKFLAMGLFGGFALGMALAAGRQILDSRLRYPQAVEAALGIRVLGVVPEERRWRRHGRRLRKAMAKKAMAKRA